MRVRCGYEVSGMILLQAHLYTYSSPSKYSPWAAMHLAQGCCHSWKHFWNSCRGITFSAVVTFFGCLQYPEILVPLSQTSLCETATSHSEPNQGNRVGVPFQQSIFGPETAWQRALCVLEHCHGGESNRWGDVKTFFYAQLQVTASIFPPNKRGWLFCLVEWIQSEQYPWQRRKWWALSSFVISTCELSLNHLCTQKHLPFHSLSPISLGEHFKSVPCILS
jgi:hypothetical protein